MLVLGRQRDETIMIGDDIEVTVVDIRGDKVRLGITAPKQIGVHRKEVYDAIQLENRVAQTDDPDLDRIVTNQAIGMSDLMAEAPVGPRPVRGCRLVDQARLLARSLFESCHKNPSGSATFDGLSFEASIGQLMVDFHRQQSLVESGVQA